MNLLSLDENQINELNSYFSSPKIANFSLVEGFMEEINMLNVLESSIPEELRAGLHLDMILNKGADQVIEYYSSLRSGTDVILEAARKILPDNAQITESIESFKKYLGELIQEDASIAALTGVPVHVPNTSRGFWATMKSLLDAATEGGSPIGILQFIIDIIGLVGDFIFPGVGVVADIINAIIYYFRGEMFLCAISIISAVVIGWGDSLKLIKGLKGLIKPSERVMVALGKDGAEAGAKEFAKISKADRGPVLNILTSIASAIGGALGKSTSLLGKFISGFSKVTDLIPGLGKLLSPIFRLLGEAITKFGDSMAKFSSNLKILKGSAEAAASHIDDVVKNGGDFIIDGDVVKLVNKEGKEVGRYSSKVIDEMSDETFAKIAAKKSGDAASAKILYKNPKQYRQMQRTLNNDAVNAGFRSRAYAFFNSTPLKKGAARFSKDLAFFIGKMIYKIIFKENWLDGKSNWSRAEVTGHGSGALNNWIDDITTKRRKETGATYLPYVELDSQDKEVYDKINDYQNHYAHLTGQPNIMKVVYDKYGNEGTMKEFDDFFKMVGKGEVDYEGKNDKVDHTIANDLEKEVTPYGEPGKEDSVTPYSSEAKHESRTILSFNDFKKLSK